MISQFLLTVSRYRQTLAINKRRRLHLSPTSTGRAFFVVGVLLTLVLLSLYGWRTVVASATEISAIDTVTAAWTKASDSGSYRFSSELKQTTNPTAKVSNAGRSGKTENLYFEGQTDLCNQKMELGNRL